MVVSDIVPVSSAQFQKTLASASPDVLREIIRELAQRMMDGEVGCGAVRGRNTTDFRCFRFPGVLR